MGHLPGSSLLAVITTACIATGSATAPRIGSLPKEATTSISAPAQSYVAVALNRGESGLVWRIARAYDSKVVVARVVRDLGSLTVWVFQTLKPGTTTVRFALTHGDRPKAYQTATYRIIVRPRS